MTTAAFMLWGFRVGLALIMLAVVYLMATAFNLVFRKTKPPQMPPAPAPAAPYHYEDFLEDLKNPAVSIDLIIVKCGGKIPAEWEKRLGPAPPSSSPGPVNRPEDREKARLEWFNQASQTTKLLKVVPPPPTPPAVPTIKAWVVNCKFCKGIYGEYLPPRMHGYKSCRWCRGTGLVMITGG